MFRTYEYRLWTILLVMAVMTVGCLFDNDGGDKKTPSKPRVEFLSLKDGQVIATRAVNVTWKGAGGATAYRYTLDGTESAWIDTTAVILYDLDEMAHDFSIVARRDTIIGEPVVRSFVVDAIRGPGLLFTPRAITGVSYVTVAIEDVDSLMAAHIELTALEGSAGFMAFQPETASDQTGTPVVFSDLSTQGRLILDIGFGGLPGGAKGRVVLGKCIIRPLKPVGEVVVDSLATVFRNTANETIAVTGHDHIRIGARE